MLGATAASADVLVVRATGPSARSYPAGRSLADNARITLAANDTLTVLDASGTRTLRGPGTFTPRGAAQETSRVSLASNQTRRARVGAVRGAGTTGASLPRSPSIWHIDVSKSSNFCLADATNPTLWRADASKQVALTIRGGAGQPERITWPAGQSTLSWPADMPASDGADYELSWNGAPAPTAIRFKSLPAKPTALNDMAASLIQHGCEAQLNLLIETVKLPEEGNAG